MSLFYNLNKTFHLFRALAVWTILYSQIIHAFTRYIHVLEGIDITVHDINHSNTE